MKKLTIVFVLCVAAVSAAAAQESSNQSLLQLFARSAQTEGITWTFVLLNDRTVDALFQAPGKYAMRARAHQATTFYVQATPEKDVQIDTVFQVEQDGQTLTSQSLNIKGFEKGFATKGKRIDGILQLDKKLDLTHPFKIKCTNNSAAEFKLTDEAVKLSENVPPPAATPAP